MQIFLVKSFPEFPQLLLFIRVHICFTTLHGNAQSEQLPDWRIGRDLVVR